MPKCNKCGGEIIFRYVDGICTPLHFSGGCSQGGSYAEDISGFRTRSWSRQVYRYASYVNPNAHCPVCGAQVFFYRSPDDGRVFFDELGPPWPKHPCTDSSIKHASSFSRKPLPSGLKFEWQLAGWEPFECRKVEETGGGITRIFGKVGGRRKEWVLYILGESKGLGAYPILIKPLNKDLGNYQLATFRFEGANVEFKEVYIDAHLPEKYR